MSRRLYRLNSSLFKLDLQAIRLVVNRRRANAIANPRMCVDSFRIKACRGEDADEGSYIELRVHCIEHRMDYSKFLTELSCLVDTWSTKKRISCTA